MPKLSVSQWVLVAVFQVFYGLAVFAVTRDYSLRECLARPVAGVASPAAPGRPPVTQPLGLPASGAAPAGLEQDDPAVLARLGDGYFGQGQYATAIPFYEKAVRIDPMDVDSHNDLGLALLYTGQSQRAIQVLEEGTKRRPKFQRIWLTLGFARVKSGDTAGGQAALSKVLELGEDTEVGSEARRMLKALEVSPPGT